MIILDKYNVISAEGRKGKRFEICFCPKEPRPWCLQRRGHGYYFPALRELLAFAAGRYLIDFHMLDAVQLEVMEALDRAWDS